MCAASADSVDFPPAHRCFRSDTPDPSSGGSPGISPAVTSHLITTRSAHMFLWQVSSSLSPLGTVTPLQTWKPECIPYGTDTPSRGSGYFKGRSYVESFSCVFFCLFKRIQWAENVTVECVIVFDQKKKHISHQFLNKV